jgi:hypothetical protein
MNNRVFFFITIVIIISGCSKNLNFKGGVYGSHVKGQISKNTSGLGGKAMVFYYDNNFWSYVLSEGSSRVNAKGKWHMEKGKVIVHMDSLYTDYMDTVVFYNYRHNQLIRTIKIENQKYTEIAEPAGTGLCSYLSYVDSFYQKLLKENNMKCPRW